MYQYIQIYPTGRVCGTDKDYILLVDGIDGQDSIPPHISVLVIQARPN